MERIIVAIDSIQICQKKKNTSKDFSLSSCPSLDLDYFKKMKKILIFIYKMDII